MEDPVQAKRDYGIGRHWRGVCRRTAPNSSKEQVLEKALAGSLSVAPEPCMALSQSLSFFLVIMWFELRTSHLLGRWSLEPLHLAFFVLGFFFPPCGTGA
jgi:hypothetical protein